MSGNRRNTRTKLTVGVIGLMLAASLVGCKTTTAPSAGSTYSAAPGKELNSLYASQWIGTGGGLLSMGDYSLEIPANAVSANTFIEMKQVASGEWPVELSPHGMQFNVPVLLSVNAQSTPGVDGMRVHWWNPDAASWDMQQSTVDSGVVSSQLQHFSRYTIK